MRFRSFGCANYKAFKQSVSIEVRPLTLFFGRNNSGKSALLRMPRLLLRALSSRAPRNGFPLELADLQFGRSFRDVVHGGAPHGAASFNIDLEEGELGHLDLSATVQNVQVSRPRPGEPSESTVVSKWELRSPMGRTLAWEPAQGAIAPTGTKERSPSVACCRRPVAGGISWSRGAGMSMISRSG